MLLVYAISEFLYVDNGSVSIVGLVVKEGGTEVKIGIPLFYNLNRGTDIGTPYLLGGQIIPGDKSSTVL